MKKFTKSLLCLIMALMLVFAVVGCGEDDSSNDDDEDEDEEETKEVKENDEEEEEEDKKSKDEDEDEDKKSKDDEDDEEEPEIDVNGAEEVVEDYISAFLDGDFKEAATYLVDSEDFASDMPTLENLLAQFGATESDFTAEQIETVETLIDQYIAAALDVVDYEIISVEVDGDNMEEVVVELEKTTIDDEVLMEMWAATLTEAGFEDDEAFFEYWYDYAVEAGYEGDDAVNIAYLAYFSEFLNAQASHLIPACDVIEKTVEAVVVYEDGQWLIESIDE